MTYSFTPTPPLFDLGQVVTTPGARDKAGSILFDCLARHSRGDWGCIDAEDKATNDDALKHGGRILSAYPIRADRPSKGWGENTVWIITEADRSATTFLLPDEY